MDKYEETNVNDQFNDKAQKIEQDKAEFLRKVLSGNLTSKHYRVGFILNNFTEARNSDIELTWLYWKTFENDLFNGSYITKEDLKKLTNLGSIIRSRARIQNEYKLFQAHGEVKKRRGVLEKELRDEAIEEKPQGLPMYSVYIDETGKTQQYLSVGSLWIIDGYQTFQASRIINEWIEKEKINFEFHFNEVGTSRLDKFKEFFLKFLTLNPTVGFKAIIIDKKGINDINKAITDLTFHLIHKGIMHENQTGRAPLPRLLQVWIDAEEKGSDQIKIENLKERISGQQMSNLYLGDFWAVDSRKNINIQIVDLFTAAINRKIHNLDSYGKVKDELSNYIFDLLNFDINEVDLGNSNTDKSKVFNLSFKG